jgi:hypothetical protein
LHLVHCTISERLAVAMNFFVLYSSMRLGRRLGSYSLVVTLFRTLWRHFNLCVPLLILASLVVAFTALRTSINKGSRNSTSSLSSSTCSSASVKSMMALAVFIMAVAVILSDRRA